MAEGWDVNVQQRQNEVADTKLRGFPEKVLQFSSAFRALEVAAGLRAGRPSVICPFVADQPFWGRRVAALGAGPEPIPQRRLTEEGLARAITRAVSDRSIAEAAGRIGRSIRAEDGVGAAVRLIDQIAAARRDARP